MQQQTSIKSFKEDLQLIQMNLNCQKKKEKSSSKFGND